jgi:hypothetical protein
VVSIQNDLATDVATNKANTLQSEVIVQEADRWRVLSSRWSLDGDRMAGGLPKRADETQSTVEYKK